MACWFTNSAAAAGQNTLVGIDNTTDSNLGRWGLQSQVTTSVVRARSSNGGANVEADSAVFTDAYRGQWHLAVGVFTSSTSRAAYVDGAYKGTNTTSNAGSSSPNRTVIGARYDSGANGQFAEGNIAHVCIWNRALTDAEVWALYDPRTRWDLYAVPSRRVYFDLAAAPGGTTWPGYLSECGWN